MFRYLDKRELFGPGGHPIQFISNVYSAGSLVRRLEKTTELIGHSGCVNALSWSETGRHLLSGSDDAQLCIWDASDYSLVCKIATGHRANIFSAKFMPQTSDTTITCCSGDGEIRVFDVHYSRSRAINEKARMRHVFSCHSSRTKRIAVEDNPWSFLSCGEDGTVRQFDLRSPHNCEDNTCPSPLVDLGLYGIELHGLTLNPFQSQYLAICGTSPFVYLYDRRMIRDDATGCVSRFVPKSNFDPSGHVTAVKFGTASRHELLGTWSGDAIYLFDIFGDKDENTSEVATNHKTTYNPSQEEVKSNGSSENSMNQSTNSFTATRSIMLETPSLISGTGDNTNTTAHTNSENIDNTSVFEDTTREDNASRENDASDSELENAYRHSANSGESANVATSTELPTIADGVEAFKNNDYKNCISIFTRLIRRKDWQMIQNAREGATFDWESVKYRDNIHSIYYRMRAIAYLQLSKTAALNSESLQNMDLALRDASRATSLNDEEPQNWWSRAVCRWALAQHETNEARRKQILAVALEHANKARSLLNADTEFIANDLNDFIDEISQQSTRDTSEADHLAPSTSRKRRRSETEIAPLATDTSNWIDRVSVIYQMPDPMALSRMDHMHDLSKYNNTDSSDINDNSSEENNYTSDSDENHINEDSSNEDHSSEDSDHQILIIGDNHDDDTSLSSQNVFDLRGFINGTGSSPQEDSSMADIFHANDSSDDGIYGGIGSSSLVGRIFNRSPCHHETSSYKGHCNVDANGKRCKFYGPRDEYIISGSDDGNLFIWEKSTGKLIQILEGDEEVVNVTEGHPFEPTIAVSVNVNDKWI
ncbi:WD40-repeat-containing domain protein [Syncephalis fuscata]|nr:WD40-repeat-containing domain protein [Syncephalis fuscata]